MSQHVKNSVESNKPTITLANYSPTDTSTDNTTISYTSTGTGGVDSNTFKIDVKNKDDTRDTITTENGKTTFNHKVDIEDRLYIKKLSLDAGWGNNGQVLTSIGGGNVIWTTVSGGGGASDLEDLSDVNISFESTGDILTYNGSNWINSSSFNGNAGTATILQTTRTIAGHNFNGSQNVTIAASDLSDITSAGSGQIITNDERTKLEGIDTSADVTDATTVAAAGAVMNTGDLSIAGNKTFTGSTIFSSDVSLNNNKITSLAIPTSDNDAANKSYVDSVAQGLDIRQSVKVTTTENITLSGTQTVDGVSLSINDRVLVKNQTNKKYNGIWTVQSGAWLRPSDFDHNSSNTSGIFVFVEQGTSNSDTGWVMTTDDSITISESNGVANVDIEFSKFTGSTTTLHDSLTSISGLTTTNDKMIYTTSSNTYAVTSLTPAAREFLDDADSASQRNTLGLGNVENTAVSSWVGSENLTTLGTIATGTWNGSVISDAYIADDITISGGNIENTVIGASTSANATFNAVTVKQLMTFQNSIQIGNGYSETLHENGTTITNTGNIQTTGMITTHGITCESDIRLKKNIKPIENALDIVQKLNGVSYDWINDNKHDIGFIAQDVEKILPMVVKPLSPDSELKGVEYQKIIVVLIEAMKELTKKFNEIVENKD